MPQGGVFNQVLQAASPALGPVGMGLSAITSLVPLVSSLVQAKRANQYKGMKRPTRNTPDSVLEATENARIQAQNPYLPGQQIALDNISATQGNIVNQGMRVGTGGGNILGMLAESAGGTNQAINNLAIQAANQQLTAQRNLQGQLNAQGAYEDQNWQYNEQQPYDEAMAAKSALHQASAENLTTGLSGISSSLINSGLFDAKKSMFNPQQQKQAQDSLMPMLTDRQKKSQLMGIPGAINRAITSAEAQGDYDWGNQGPSVPFIQPMQQQPNIMNPTKPMIFQTQRTLPRVPDSSNGFPGSPGFGGPNMPTGKFPFYSFLTGNMSY